MKLFLESLLGIKQYLSNRKKFKRRQKQLNRPKRTQKRFKKKYPYSFIGTGTYGVPIIRHRHANTTLTIGNYCSIASNVEIFLGGNHRTDWISTYPFPQYYDQANHIADYTTTNGNVTIGSDVWLCQNVTIFSGITIGNGAVVANGAIVTKDVPPYAIVGGNPAKLIRWRFDETTRIALLATEWWNWPEEEVFSMMDKLCSDNIADFLAYADSRKTSKS